MVTISLALVLRALGDFEGGHDVGAGGDADENAFLLREAAGHGEGVVVGDLDALGDLRVSRCVLEVEILRDEAGAGALDLVRAGLQRLAGERLR